MFSAKRITRVNEKFCSLKEKCMTRILLILLAVFVWFDAEANQASSKDVAIYKRDMKRIEKYLNSISTFIAVFEQKTADNEISEGTFYLSRPGKLRWDYDAPTPITIVAKGSLLSYYDRELDQISHISLDDNLAGFLIQKNISFDSGVEVLKFVKKNGRIMVTIAQKNKEDEGQLTMVFSDQRIELKELGILDAIGKQTIVSFNSPIYGKKINSKIFSMQTIRKENRSN